MVGHAKPLETPKSLTPPLGTTTGAVFGVMGSSHACCSCYVRVIHRGFKLFGGSQWP